MRGMAVPGRERQALTKGNESLTIALPNAAVEVRHDRKDHAKPTTEDRHVLAGAGGIPVCRVNIRTHLRVSARGSLNSRAPDTLRRTVRERTFEVYGRRAIIDVCGGTHQEVCRSGSTRRLVWIRYRGMPSITSSGTSMVLEPRSLSATPRENCYAATPERSTRSH